MLDVQSYIGQLKRPKLLVRAARFGMSDYRRDRDLRRALKTDNLPRPADALMQLSSIEAEQNEMRIKNSAHYSFAKHLDILVAIMAEAQLFEVTRKPRSIT